MLPVVLGDVLPKQLTHAMMQNLIVYLSCLRPRHNQPLRRAQPRTTVFPACPLSSVWASLREFPETVSSAKEVAPDPILYRHIYAWLANSQDPQDIAVPEPESQTRPPATQDEQVKQRFALHHARAASFRLQDMENEQKDGESEENQPRRVHFDLGYEQTQAAGTVGKDRRRAGLRSKHAAVTKEMSCDHRNVYEVGSVLVKINDALILWRPLTDHAH